MLKRLELSNKEIINLCKYSKKENWIFISFLVIKTVKCVVCKVDYVKVPRGKKNTFWLKEISKLKKIIISTECQIFLKLITH